MKRRKKAQQTKGTGELLNHLQPLYGRSFIRDTALASTPILFMRFFEYSSKEAKE
jgi:hypothetical protein